MKRTFIAALVAAGVLLGGAGAAFADPKPPTNGGNGAGQQRTMHRPSRRPAGVLPESLIDDTDTTRPAQCWHRATPVASAGVARLSGRAADDRFPPECM